MILFVDDEPRDMDSYVLVLKLSGYEVIFESDVDSAWKSFEAKHDKIKLLILDIMMPAGNLFENANTEEGLRTGIRFYEKVRQDNPTLPIIIFSNVTDDGVVKKIDKKEKTCFFQKEDFLPLALVEEIKEILGS